MSIPVGGVGYLHIAANGELAADPAIVVSDATPGVVQIDATADPFVYKLTGLAVSNYAINVQATASDGSTVMGSITDSVTSPAATQLQLTITDSP